MIFRFLLCLSLLLPGVGWASGGPVVLRDVVLRDTSRAYALPAQGEVLLAVPPPGTSFTLAQVRAAPLAGRFRALGAAAARSDATPSEPWLRCRVQNAGGPATAWVLDAGRYYGNFDLYVVRDDGTVQHLAADRHRHWATVRAVPTRRYNLNLPLAAGQAATLYIHSRGPQLYFSIYERTHLLNQGRIGDGWACLYFGMLLGLTLYNLLLFFSIRDRSYLYYVVFTASFGLLQVLMMGYALSWWGYWLTNAREALMQDAMLSVVMAAGILTTRSFLDTRRSAPRFDLALRGLLLAVPTLLLAWAVQAWAVVAVLEKLLPLLQCALLLVGGTWLLFKGSRAARYYMAGWSVLIAAIVWYYLSALGVVEAGFWSSEGVRLASALEVLLISLGLGDRINLTRRERHAAQAEALAALREKETAQTAANQALALRATELQHAYAELQTSHHATDLLQEADLLKTRFFTNISHELRTPLTLILGPLAQVMGRPEAAPLAAEHGLMQRHGQRLLALLNQLLDVARLEARQLRLHAQPTDLGAFVRTHAAAFDSLAAAQGVALAVETPPQPLPAWIDHDQVQKIMTNLLGNAFKFSPAGAAVRVRLTAAGGQAVLTVADTGCGIPAAHLPLIFDRFHQADASASRHHEGAGIGLALVKELVALHQGRIAVASTEGAGTTFTVYFPLGDSHLAAEEKRPLAPAEASSADASAPVRPVLPGLPALLAGRPVAAGTQGAAGLVPDPATGPAVEPLPDTRPLVLVIDDHPDMRAYVSSCLTDTYRVKTASGGLEGLADIAALGPDLVVSDVMMPGLDGMELCRRVKTDEASSHIPVVLLTARASDQSKLAGLELGADDYLTKPFRPAELLARVHNLIAGRQLLRRRFGREMTLQPRDIALTSADERFLTRALAVVEAHLADPEFSAEGFASAMALSRMHLHRKLKALTDQSATEFVRTLRLRRAAQLLAGHAGTVADVAYATGFGNLSHFARCFREEFGQTPSAYAAAGVV